MGKGGSVTTMRENENRSMRSMRKTGSIRKLSNNRAYQKDEKKCVHATDEEKQDLKERSEDQIDTMRSHEKTELTRKMRKCRGCWKGGKKLGP